VSTEADPSIGAAPDVAPDVVEPRGSWWAVPAYLALSVVLIVVSIVVSRVVRRRSDRQKA
jgi:hypothetical protein